MMTTRNTPPLRVIGLTWFREEDYPALLRVFQDGDKMPRTWKEWLKNAEDMEQKAKAQAAAQGAVTERVYIDPDTFPDWCARNGVQPDREGRHKFVAHSTAPKYMNQS